MRAGGTIETGLVAAARAGDRHALDGLVAASLPLVYTVVRQALNGHPDTDDVVQDVMVRALRQLPTLRKPDSYRTWLTTIAVNQISTYLHRRAAGTRWAAPLDAAGALPDPGLEFEDLTVLQVELSAQRRQVVRAGEWLDPDDRVLLSLWLLEVAGELTRADVATAIGATVPHTGVRVQRMRQHLDASRELVAALDARPRCAGLDAATAGWDGTPTPLWRKRLVRHTRTCRVCRSLGAGLVPAERLLPGLAVLLPVPIALTAALLGKATAAAPAALAASSSAVLGASSAALGASSSTAVGASSSAVLGASGASTGAGVKAGIFAQLLQSVVAHPIAASVAAGALAAGAAVTAATLPPGTPAPHASIAAPASPNPPPATPFTARPGTAASPARVTTPARSEIAGTVSLAPGRKVSVESADEPGQFVTATGDIGFLAAVRPGSDYTSRRRATFTAVAGLADPRCFSFRAENGRYLRHSSWRLRLDPDQGTPLFRGDATFCVGAGSPATAVTLESANYPGWFLHHRADELWVDQTDESAAFRTETSFWIRSGLAT